MPPRHAVGPLLLALGAALLVSWPVFGELAPVNLVVPQAASPVAIARYGVGYEDATAKAPDGIRHAIVFHNNGDRVVEAVEVGVIAFDVWNRFLDAGHATVIQQLRPRKRGEFAWRELSDAAYTVHTGVAFVSRVRFDDGEIWTADRAEIVRELQRIDADFDPALLPGSRAAR
jgi:hypothetical protein